MRVLFDTNIFIYREDNNIVEEDLQELLRLLNELGCSLVIHPLSIEEINKDKDQERKKVILSKLKSYPLIKDPPNPQGDMFFESNLGKIEENNNPHDIIDINLLYSVYKNAVSIMITEDNELHHQAHKVNLSDRVLNIVDAINSLNVLNHKKLPAVRSPPAIKEEYLYNLDIKDPFFDSLREDYKNFNEWFGKKAQAQKKAFVFVNEDKRLGAFLLLKEEDEPIDAKPLIPRKRRLKISTFKVINTGSRIGELFLKISISHAISMKVCEMYLTHYVKFNDPLIQLILPFGFKEIAKKEDGESVFMKELCPEKDVHNIQKIRTDFYPCFYDGNKVNKFLIPIKPKYHEKLFNDYPSTRQTILTEHSGGFIIEGNTILKAYICNSKTHQIKVNDIVLFYRTTDKKIITAIGTVDQIYYDLNSSQEILNYISKRTVYTKSEIENFKKPLMVLLFTWHFYLPNALTYNELKDKGILRGSLQSIKQISHQEYLKIKRLSKMDQQYTIWDF